MRVLGIESSCDETAAAVVEAQLDTMPGATRQHATIARGRVLSDVVRSQISLHGAFGGVVPELASRDHARAIGPVVFEALSASGTPLGALDAIAVTSRPGLAGALLVGLQTAKGLAWAAQKPLVGVDHLVGHLLAIYLDRSPQCAGGEPLPIPAFPFLGLLVSGGHTALYRVNGPYIDSIVELGATRDDAAGEAFDKVGKLLGLPYPGGPAIDRLAARGDAAAASKAGLDELPRETLEGSLELSFSGLKSSLARAVARLGPLDEPALADICAAFQSSVVSSLVRKTMRAAAREDLTRVVLAGGVAANKGLRSAMRAACARRGLEFFVPDLASCTDNAAMIAYAGLIKHARGHADGFDLAPATRTELLRATRKGRGPRAPR